jgi:hypothetical protein
MLPENRDFDHGRAARGASSGCAPSVTELLATDTPVARTELYLRLLYSDASADAARTALAAAAVGGPTAAMLQQIDWQGLDVERRARRRNLFAQLVRRSPTLMGAIGEPLLRPLLDAFTNDDAFWSGSGRTLLENFAFAVHDRLRRDGFDYEADVLVLEALISGVHSDSDLPPPWTCWDRWAGPIEVQGAEHAESLVTRWQLLDADGRLPTADTVAATRTPKLQRIVVARLPEREMFLFSVEL